jgi:DNA-binding CsgD family transcriptional regulator
MTCGASLTADVLERARDLAEAIAAPGAEPFEDVVTAGIARCLPGISVTFCPQGRVIDEPGTVLVLGSGPSGAPVLVADRQGGPLGRCELDLLALLAPHLREGYRAATVGSILTPRQREVLGLVGTGLTNRQVARRLGISPATVRAHLEQSFAKLGVGTRTAAVAAVR